MELGSSRGVSAANKTDEIMMRERMKKSNRGDLTIFPRNILTGLSESKSHRLLPYLTFMLIVVFFLEKALESVILVCLVTV